MSISVECSKGHVFHAPDYLSGGQVRCPRCFRPVVVPINPSAPDTRLALLARDEAALAGGLSDAWRSYRRRTRWLAFVWGLLAIAQCWPVFGRAGLAAGPGWSKVVLVAATLQVALALALANVPDWSSLWAAMLALAAVAAGYALAWSVVLFAAPTIALAFELDQVAVAARAWCGGVTLATSALAIIAGRAAVQWHRAALLQ